MVSKKALTSTSKPATAALSDARRLPFRFLPDYATGTPDWSITRLSRIKPDVPLIFDGVWCFNDDPARIHARHNAGRSTNLLYADGHCDTQLTASLPTDAWQLR